MILISKPHIYNYYVHKLVRILYQSHSFLPYNNTYGHNFTPRQHIVFQIQGVDFIQSTLSLSSVLSTCTTSYCRGAGQENRYETTSTPYSQKKQAQQYRYYMSPGHPSIQRMKKQNKTSVVAAQILYVTCLSPSPYT